MKIKYFGMWVEDVLFEDKVPYKFFKTSSLLSTEQMEAEDMQTFEKFEDMYAKRNKKLFRYKPEGQSFSAYYISIPNFWIMDNENKHYELQDTVNLKDAIDKERGLIYLGRLKERLYNIKLYKDYERELLYIYVEKEEQDNNGW